MSRTGSNGKPMSRGCGRRRPTDLRGAPVMNVLASSSIPHARVVLLPMAVSGAENTWCATGCQACIATVRHAYASCICVVMSSVLRRQQAHLPQHCSMIPIDPFTGEFSAAKLYDDDNINGDFLVGWGDIWQKPGHGLTVGKRDVQFIHELPLADHPVDRRH